MKPEVMELMRRGKIEVADEPTDGAGDE